MASVDPTNSDATIAKVKTLVNNQLKQILKKEGLPVSGAKATLQSRIIDRESQLLRFHVHLCNATKAWRSRTSPLTDLIVPV